MNYFEIHIGDYVEATQHLTLLEDGVYGRLIRKYYAKERPLPADLADVQRLVGARTREERAAVDRVVREFFVLADDGWHQDRCDEAIAAYQEGEPEREARRVNEDVRVKRHRAERAALFARLSAAGQHAPWNIRVSELRDMVAKLPPDAAPATPAVTPPVTAPVTPVTATQSPFPIPQLPRQEEIQATADAVAGARPSDGPPAQPVSRAQLTLVEPVPTPTPKGPPDCPHQAVLALWAEVLPHLPQHEAHLWRGTRADHLRTRWRETAVAKHWTTQAQGLTYLRRLFAYVGQSPFLTGREYAPGKRPFLIELAWLVEPTNWAKVIEGKFHPMEATK